MSETQSKKPGNVVQLVPQAGSRAATGQGPSGGQGRGAPPPKSPPRPPPSEAPPHEDRDDPGTPCDSPFGVEPYRQTDVGNATRLIHRFGKNIRWCAVMPHNGVLVWDGNRWTSDSKSTITAYTHAVARDLVDEVATMRGELARLQAMAAGSIPTPPALALTLKSSIGALEGRIKVAAKWAEQSEMSTRLKAMAEQALHQVAINFDELDADPMLLNTARGLVDLRAGELRAPVREDLITKIAGAKANHAAKCSTWIAFLTKIMGGDADPVTAAEMVGFLQRITGYCLTGMTSEQCMFILHGHGSNGKALALTTPIPTPTGWTTQGDLKVGDQVLDDQGRPCNVVGVTQVWNDRPCYRMRFSDGTEVVADAEHEWPVRTAFRKVLSTGPRAKGRQEGLTLRTTKVMSGRIVSRERTIFGRSGAKEYRWAMPATLPLDLPAATLPVDPYMLGAWLGDGTSRTAAITSGNQDVDHWIEQIRASGLHVRPWQRKSDRAWKLALSTNPNFSGSKCENLTRHLRDIDVLNNKHIPVEYLRSSYAQRLALLQGLMDTDGSTLKRQAQCEYTSVNKALADGVRELVRSLGLIPVISEGRATIYGRDVGPKYRVLFTTPAGVDVFRMKRKLAICRARKSPLVRKLVACDEVESVPVCCIQVDSPSHLYLCSEAMIPTHNSTFLDVIREVFGEYAMHARAQTFMQSQQTGGIPNDVAAFRGARLITSSEPKQGEPLDESLIKEMTGDAALTARFMRAEFFTFEPTFKVFLATNHLPKITGTDHGIWRRIRLIPFTVTIADDEKDPNLKKKLLAERDGILRWAVQGCGEWLNGDAATGAPPGLRPPDRVVQATKQYRNDMDVLADFLAERCVLGEGRTTTNSDLYNAFKSWCIDNGVNGGRPKSHKWLTLQMKAKKFQTDGRKDRAPRWEGIEVIEREPPPFSGGYGRGVRGEA